MKNLNALFARTNVTLNLNNDNDRNWIYYVIMGYDDVLSDDFDIVGYRFPGYDAALRAFKGMFERAVIATLKSKQGMTSKAIFHSIVDGLKRVEIDFNQSNSDLYYDHETHRKEAVLLGLFPKVRESLETMKSALEDEIHELTDRAPSGMTQRAWVRKRLREDLSRTPMEGSVDELYRRWVAKTSKRQFMEKVESSQRELNRLVVRKKFHELTNTNTNALRTFLNGESPRITKRLTLSDSNKDLPENIANVLSRHGVTVNPERVVPRARTGIRVLGSLVKDGTDEELRGFLEREHRAGRLAKLCAKVPGIPTNNKRLLNALQPYYECASVEVENRFARRKRRMFDELRRFQTGPIEQKNLPNENRRHVPYNQDIVYYPMELRTNPGFDRKRLFWRGFMREHRAGFTEPNSPKFLYRGVFRNTKSEIGKTILNRLQTKQTNEAIDLPYVDRNGFYKDGSFQSWTSDLNVAKNFAKNDGIVFRVSVNNLRRSKNALVLNLEKTLATRRHNYQSFKDGAIPGSLFPEQKEFILNIPSKKFVVRPATQSLASSGPKVYVLSPN
eukprot:466198-Prorocentrum_minimum.AAC.7